MGKAVGSTISPTVVLGHPRLFYGLFGLNVVFMLAPFGLVRLRPPTGSDPASAEVGVRVVALPPKPEGSLDKSGDGTGKRYTREACAARTGELRELCFHQLARQMSPEDLAGAVLACGELPAGERLGECLADVAEAHARVDREAALSQCPRIESGKWRDQCVFGVALARVALEPQASFELCDSAGRWRDFCRHDVNGEIAVVDTDLALAHCAREEGDLLTRKSCWHGIGKYIARVDVERAKSACGRVPAGPDNLYVENCWHGLAWGASETAGRAFAERCGEAGPQADSCMLGVAYNLRRFDPEGAVALCEAAQRADLREKCLDFVVR